MQLARVGLDGHPGDKQGVNMSVGMTHNMCGFQHVWLSTCVAFNMCGFQHVWLSTCVAFNMCHP